MTRHVPVLLAALAMAACDGEPLYRRYATASATVAAGERDRGWFPAWMPLSARDVYLQGDLDTNQWWLRAQLSPAAADSLRELLVPVAADSVRAPRPRGGGGWWFEALVQHAPANDAALNAHLFRGTGAPVPRTTVVAFDRLSDTVYAWDGTLSDGAGARGESKQATCSPPPELMNSPRENRKVRPRGLGGLAVCGVRCTCASAPTTAGSRSGRDGYGGAAGARRRRRVDEEGVWLRCG